MADRVLVWHHEGTIRGNESRIGPTFYLDADYEPVEVRIHAETAPSVDDAEFDIKLDDISIFANRTSTPFSRSGREDGVTLTTTVVLSKGDNYEVNGEDFKEGLVMEEGQWVWCKPIKGGKGKNFTIALEVENVSDEKEPLQL